MRNAVEDRNIQRLLNLLKGRMLWAGFLIVVVYDQLDLVLIDAQVRERGHVALRVAHRGEILIDHEEDGRRDRAGAHHHFIVDVLASVDDHGIVLINEEGGELAEHVFAEVVALFERIGRTHQEETERIARDETFEERLIELVQIFRHFEERILRRGAELHGNVVSHPIEIDHHGGLLALGEDGPEVDRERSGSYSALRTEKGIDLAEFAFARASRAPRSTLEAGHGVAEIDALQGLQKKLIRARPHGGDDGIAIGDEMRG